MVNPVEPSDWAPDPDRYVEQRRVSSGVLPATPGVAPEDRLRAFGITWSDPAVDGIRPSSVERACHRFRALFPELIWDTAALEGNTFTLPEVRTLLEGVTVGGRPLEDEQQVLALRDAYHRLDQLVSEGSFALTKAVSDELHSLVARHEAIESGHFRGEGLATGGGHVRLAGGGTVEGAEPGPGGERLLAHFDELVKALAGLGDARRRALVYFASATRRQFYFDGNKRTARLMMAGELLSHGYDAVSIPFARRLEFNIALDEMFTTSDATNLLAFLVTCTI